MRTNRKLSKTWRRLCKLIKTESPIWKRSYKSWDRKPYKTPRKERMRSVKTQSIKINTIATLQSSRHKCWTPLPLLIRAWTPTCKDQILMSTKDSNQMSEDLHQVSWRWDLEGLPQIGLGLQWAHLPSLPDQEQSNARIRINMVQIWPTTLLETSPNPCSMQTMLSSLHSKFQPSLHRPHRCTASKL